MDIPSHTTRAYNPSYIPVILCISGTLKRKLFLTGLLHFITKLKKLAMIITLFKTVTSGILPVERGECNQRKQNQKDWHKLVRNRQPICVCFMIKNLERNKESRTENKHCLSLSYLPFIIFWILAYWLFSLLVCFTKKETKKTWR